MTVSNAKRVSIAKYQQEKCDRITADVPKGKRYAYKLIAAELNLSLSQLIQNGVEGYARNYTGEVVVPVPKPESETISAEERRLIQAFGNCPDNMKPTLRKLIEQLAQTKGGD